MKFPKGIVRGHYWICNACATERGATWPPDRVATVISGTCPYCCGSKQLEQTITPWVDFDWPDVNTAHQRD